jgi:hypothetical protein
MHSTPISSSWLNLVERFFADLTGDGIRAGSLNSVSDLLAPTQIRSPSTSPASQPRPASTT